jgi:Holliday junction resolvase-like predicted endonuclease
MSNVSKGYSKEKLCRDQLKADGWFIVFKSVRWKWGTIDYATLFDVVAYKGQERKFISCKHLSNGDHHLPHQASLLAHKQAYGKPGESYEVWLWDKPRWTGRVPNKVWQAGGFRVIVI